MAGILHLMLYLTPVKVPPTSRKVMPVATLVRRDTSVTTSVPRKYTSIFLKFTAAHVDYSLYLIERMSSILAKFCLTIIWSAAVRLAYLRCVLFR